VCAIQLSVNLFYNPILLHTGDEDGYFSWKNGPKDGKELTHYVEHLECYFLANGIFANNKASHID